MASRDTSAGTASSSAPPSAEPAPPVRDEWLSRALGLPVYAVTRASAAAETDGLAWLRVPVDEVASVHELVEFGYRVVDTSITLARRGPIAGAHGDAATVAPATPQQHDALVEIAGSCFRYSRFHLDPLIPNDAADRVKREWVRSYVRGQRGLELLAASVGDEAAGFLAVLHAADGARVIDLVGVSPSHQGRGVGAALVTAFSARHGDAQRELRVGTQAANAPSLRLYERLGFQTVAAAYVLHRHGRV